MRLLDSFHPFLVTSHLYRYIHAYFWNSTYVHSSLFFTNRPKNEINIWNVVSGLQNASYPSQSISIQTPWSVVLTFNLINQKTPPKERVKEFGPQGAVLFDPVYTKETKNRIREERSKDFKEYLEVTSDTAYDWLAGGGSLPKNQSYLMLLW